MMKKENTEITMPEHSTTACSSSSDSPCAFPSTGKKPSDSKNKGSDILIGIHSIAIDMSAIKESVENKSYRIKFQDLFDLTRSICHELSQPITILLGYSEMMLLNIEKNDPLYKKLSEINKQADKTDEIIRRMQRKIKYIAEESISGSEIIGKI